METNIGQMNEDGVGLPTGVKYDPKESYYMHVNTGTVQSQEDWLEDCTLAEFLNDDSLVEVYLVNGEWVEDLPPAFKQLKKELEMDLTNGF